MQARSLPENLGWMMDPKRKAAYYTLCAAQEENVPLCAEQGPKWDLMEKRDQATLCKSCPLKAPCKAYAETDPINTWGVWGGQLYPRTASGRITKGWKS